MPGLVGRSGSAQSCVLVVPHHRHRDLVPLGVSQSVLWCSEKQDRVGRGGDHQAHVLAVRLTMAPLPAFPNLHIVQGWRHLSEDKHKENPAKGTWVSI